MLKCFFVAVVTVLMTAPSNRDGDEVDRLAEMKWSCLQTISKTHRVFAELHISPGTVEYRYLARHSFLNYYRVVNSGSNIYHCHKKCMLCDSSYGSLRLQLLEINSRRARFPLETFSSTDKGILCLLNGCSRRGTQCRYNVSFVLTSVCVIEGYLVQWE